MTLSGLLKELSIPGPGKFTSFRSDGLRSAPPFSGAPCRPDSGREGRSDSRVAGKDRSAVRIGNFLMFEDLKPGDKIQLEFPIRERSAEYTANSRTEMEQTYKCTFRGSTLVDISPRDSSPTSYPLYVRQHMRRDKAPMKKTSRFVAERTVSQW